MTSWMATPAIPIRLHTANALGVRTDYYQTTKAAREAAENGKVLSSYAFEAVDGQEKTVELRALKSTRLTNPGGSAVSGTLYSCISAFHDYDGNGVMDPRETIMYIPDTAKKYGEDGAPRGRGVPRQHPSCGNLL